MLTCYTLTTSLYNTRLALKQHNQGYTILKPMNSLTTVIYKSQHRRLMYVFGEEGRKVFVRLEEEAPLSLGFIEATQAELMPSNVWCSITVSPMKAAWLCINQCHMCTERWAALPRDVLKPIHESMAAGGLLNADWRRHWETGLQA